MADNLDRYLPEWNDALERAKINHFTREQLVDLLLRAYREKRVLAKSLGEKMTLLTRVRDLLDEPSLLQQSLGVPTPEDLRRMMEDTD